MILIVAVPHRLKVLIHKLLLLDSFELADLPQYVSGSDVGLVFCQDAATVGFTEWGHVFANAFLDVFLVVSEIFLLLDKAELLLLFFLLRSLLRFFLLLLSLCLLVLLALLFIHFRLFSLLGVFWAVDPLDMSFSLIVLVHKCHNLIELGFVLSLLFGVRVLGSDISLSLHVGDFNRGESRRRVLVFILRPLESF